MDKAGFVGCEREGDLLVCQGNKAWSTLGACVGSGSAEGDADVERDGGGSVVGGAEFHDGVCIVKGEFRVGMLEGRREKPGCRKHEHADGKDDGPKSPGYAGGFSNGGLRRRDAVWFSKGGGWRRGFRVWLHAR